MANTIFQLVSVIVLINVEYVYAENYMRACFFNSSARFRTTEARFSVQDIDFSLCTHYIYNYARIDVQGRTVVPADPAVEEGTGGLYEQFTSTPKSNNPNMKTLLSVGGPGHAGDAAFEALHRHDTEYLTFSDKAMSYAYRQNFSGINIHWEVQKNSSGKTLLLKLMERLKRHSQRKSLLITMTGYGSSHLIEAKYNVSELQKHVDYVFVNCHDMVTPNVASFIGPLFISSENPTSATNMNYAINFYKHHGVPYGKLVMMVSALGHFVQLKDPNVTVPGSTASTVVLRGQKYLLDNRLAYPEICEKVPTSRRYFDNKEKSPYLVHGSEWIGYTDTVSIDERIPFMTLRGLGGIAFTNLDEDDFRGTACHAGRFPLVTYIRQALDPVPGTTTATAPRGGPTAERIVPTFVIHIHRPSTTTTQSTSPPTTAPRRPNKKAMKQGPIGYYKYLKLLFLFVIGHMIGHMFMLFSREMRVVN